MKPNQLSIDDIKARLFIPDVWRMLQLPGEPGKCCKSPFREERKPSFSVFDDGRRFRDHASGDAGTVIDFIQLALNVPLNEALDWARKQCGEEGVPLRPHKPAAATAVKPSPKLRQAKQGELEALAALRGLSLVTLADAQERGLLAFADVWGRVAWLVCDPGGRIAEGRRLDGKPWEAFGSMPERKCHAWGGQKNWPVNLEDSQHCTKLVLVEGGPDVLAALEILRRESKADAVGVVGILGASNTRLDEKALPFFRQKMVRLFPHADDAGRKAARTWARVLVDAGAARVDAFDLSRLMRSDGKPGKDLCDLVNISPECRARWQKFQREVMP
ncbi:MAG: hypothetical protein JNJ83_16940 [Verrucomicrobiaceae bacterium]|nr:hypothetical protein [Verrucomicrobiaceae bacterium]